MLKAARGIGGPGGSSGRERRGALAFVFGVALLAMSDAHAAAVGSLVTAVGPLAALVALFAIKGWSGYGSVAAPLSAGLCVLGAGAGATWLARRRAPGARRAPSKAVRAAVSLPAGWDQEHLLREMREHFLALQSAWDLGDVPALKDLATPQMLEELLVERGRCAAPAQGGGARSEVITLDATLIGFDETPRACVVSVEFSGSMREAPQTHAVPFRELWMLMQSTPGKSAWLLARHHTLL